MSQERIDVTQIKKRFMELANRSYQKNQYVFSEFLTLEEQSILLSMEKEISFAGIHLYGGREEVERKIACFGNFQELGYEEDYPMVILKVYPSAVKFAQELSHRDYLGAIMNLGIRRSQVGDILINNKTAYVFLLASMKEYVMDGLTKIGHTYVTCTELMESEEIVSMDHIKEERIIVHSMRIDGILSHVYHLSRSQSLTLFTEHKVFVNDRMIEGNSILLKEEDRVSVRGFGRFVMGSSIEQTKKEKYTFLISRYI